MSRDVTPVTGLLLACVLGFAFGWALAQLGYSIGDAWRLLADTLALVPQIQPGVIL